MEIQTLYNITSYISALSILIPFSASIIKYKTLNLELRVLFIYIIICALTEIVGLMLSKSKTPGYILEHIFAILECTLITFIYTIRYKATSAKKIILVFYTLFIIAVIYVFLYLQDFNRENSLISTFESVFIMALSGVYFYNLVNELTLTTQNEYDFFWLNTAFLFYFSMAFFLFLFDDLIEKLDLPIFYLLYSLHLISNIVYNILLSIGIWKIKRI